MLASRFPTLSQHLIEERRRFPEASGCLNGLIFDIVGACKIIASQVGSGLLAWPDLAAQELGNSECQTLQKAAHDIFAQTIMGSGNIAGLASQISREVESVEQYALRGRYLLIIDPLDGASNIDLNVPMGSIFSILRAPEGDRPLKENDFFQPGSAQVAAGYVLYGPSTTLMLTVGNGVQGFTLDSLTGDFFLTHPDIVIPPNTDEFAINASYSRFWGAPIKRYIDECIAGETGPRKKDFNMRWIDSTVADAHRVLMRGGVFMAPLGNNNPHKQDALRLLYECNPIGMLVEQAQGVIGTGTKPLLTILPESLHQRTTVIFGSKNEVDRIQRYHTTPQTNAEHSPLFGRRGLFR